MKVLENREEDVSRSLRDDGAPLSESRLGSIPAPRGVLPERPAYSTNSEARLNRQACCGRRRNSMRGPACGLAAGYSSGFEKASRRFGNAKMEVLPVPGGECQPGYASPPPAAIASSTRKSIAISLIIAPAASSPLLWSRTARGGSGLRQGVSPSAKVIAQSASRRGGTQRPRPSAAPVSMSHLDICQPPICGNR